MRVEELVAFMRARHDVFLRRQRGQEKPWTDDPILRTYKFTNIYRELDRVTIWIRDHIREPYAGNPNLWFMLALARQINWPDTLAELIAEKVWPTESYDWKKTRRVMLARQARGEKLYTGAYIIFAQAQRGGDIPPDKAYITTRQVMEPLWQDREKIARAMSAGTLQAAHEALTPYYGWGGFMAYEAVSDLRWTPRFEKAPDIMTWAHAGPGAKRGLNRVFGRPVKKGLSAGQALDEMRLLFDGVSRLWPKPSKDFPKIEMREIEGSLCEFDKYERVRLEQGRPRSLYDGG